MRKLLLIASCVIVGFGRVNPFVLPQASSSVTSSSLNPTSSSAASVQSSSNSLAPSEKIEYGFGTLLLYPNYLVIKTTDPLKRSFTLDSPKKIVLDFAKKRAFPSKKISLHHPLFTQLQMGAHTTFYRIAISVSKDCRLHVQKGNGYRVSCLLDASSSVSAP